MIARVEIRTLAYMGSLREGHCYTSGSTNSPSRAGSSRLASQAHALGSCRAKAAVTSSARDCLRAFQNTQCKGIDFPCPGTLIIAFENLPIQFDYLIYMLIHPNINARMSTGCRSCIIVSVERMDDSWENTLVVRLKATWDYNSVHTFRRKCSRIGVECARSGRSVGT